MAFISHPIRKIAFILAIILVFAALLVSSGRLLTPVFNDHKTNFENWAGQVLNAPVKIGHIQLGWDFYEPELTFSKVDVLNQSNQVQFEVQEIKVNLQVIRSFLLWKPLPESIKINGAFFTLREINGAYDIDGFQLTDNFSGSSLKNNEMLAWILSNPFLLIKNIEIHYIPINQPERLIILDQVSLLNNFYSHSLKGRIHLQQEHPSTVDFDIRWRGNITNLSTVNAHCYLNVEQFSFADWNKLQTFGDINIPEGVGNFNAEANFKNNHWQNTAGNFEFQNLQFNDAKIFANSLILNHISSEFKAERKNETWQIHLTNISAKNADANGKANMDLSVPDEGSPSVNLLANFDMANAKAVSNYLPLQIFDPKLNEWLRQAFRGGQVVSGKAILQGRMSDFPFDEPNSGTFIISGLFHQVDFNYAPGWPEINNASGKLIFSGRSMIAELDSASVLNNAVKGARGVISDMGSSIKPTLLTVNGNIQTDLTEGLKFIRQSPLDATIGKNLQGVDLKGPMDLHLGLNIPLKNPEETKVTGTVNLLSDATLSLPEWKITIDHLRGVFQFTEQSLLAQNMTGQLWDSPMTLNLVTDTQNGKQSIKAILAGELSLSHLSTWSDMDLSKFAQGKTTYQAELQLGSRTQNIPTTLSISSNLRGISLSLPAPYAKNSNSVRPLQIKMTLNNNPVTTIKYSDLKIDASPRASTWNVNIASPMMQGQIEIPKVSGKQITAKFQRINFSASRAQSSYNVKPGALPPLSIVVNNFTYDNINIGQVILNTTPKNNGLNLQQLLVNSPNYRIHATGDWDDGGSSVQGDLMTKNINHMLSQWGYPATSLVGTTANMHFALSWPGALFSPSVNRLSGKVSLNLGEGRIINLSNANDAKLGIARMLNILNLNTLPRRLSLDFSDLFEKGYSFDYMKGDFNLNNGNAMTNNMRVDGPVARIDIAGRIGLAAKDYDLKMNVTPYVTSSLPIVATIAGGPIAGIATWVVDKVVSQGVSRVTTYNYLVRGPWNNPVWSKSGSSSVGNSQNR